ncbi:MAG: glutathione S-transferase family protein [Pseudomonadota bacterium]
MTYVLYGAPGSGSGIVEAVCAELGVDYETRDLDAAAGEHRAEDYAALNPQRKLPTLEFPHGEHLTETLAIVLALDELHRDAEILPPPGTPERRLALRWMAFLATELYPLVEIFDYPERFAEPAAATALQRRSLEIRQERWLLLESQVRGPWLLGSTFCATDLYISHLSRWDLPADWRREYLPKTVTLADAVAARPALAGVYARHFRLESVGTA